MNTLFNNKSAYDPGRFRYSVSFIQETVDIDGAGNQTPGYEVVLSTKAVREAVTRRFQVAGDTTFVAGSTLMNNYWYFTIRYRKGFKPLKDMLLQTADGIYTITAAPELDEPPHYWRLLCVKTDKQLTT